MYYISLGPYSKTFYNEWKLDEESSDYNIVFTQNLSGNLDIPRLSRALQRFVEDYVLLNSHIKIQDFEPFWIENKLISTLELAKKTTSCEDVLNYIKQPFCLESGPLYRFLLIEKTSNRYELIIVLHHIVVSGSSFSFVCEEISKYYNEIDYRCPITKDEQISLLQTMAATQYKILNANKKTSKRFWDTQLSGLQPIKFDFIEQPSFNLNDNILEKSFSFDFPTLIKTSKLKEQYNISSYLFGKCIYALLLNFYTGIEKFCISYPIAIKNVQDFIYGAQVNTNIISFDFSKDNDFFKLLMKTKKTVVKTFDKNNNHHLLPIYEIINLNNKYLLNIVYSQADLQSTCVNFEGVNAEAMNNNIHFAGELVFEQQQCTKEIKFKIRTKKPYACPKLLHDFVEHYQALYLSVLDDLLSSNSKKIKKISNDLFFANTVNKSMLTSQHTSSLLSNDNQSLISLFEKQVAQNPNNIALVFAENELSYHALNQKSNQMANYLVCQKQITADTLIILAMDRGQNLIVSLLAILKAGAAYVAVEPDLPAARIQYILEDTKSKIVITNTSYTEKFKSLRVSIDYKLIVADDLNIQKKIMQCDPTNLNIFIKPNNLAYVTYTSGTTGKPKGVMQEHANVVRLFAATNKLYEFTANDVWILFHSCAFDFSVWEIWGALLFGGKLIIPTTTTIQDFNLFFELCQHEKVTVLNQTPTAFYQFADIALKKPLTSLRYVVLGGEALNVEQLKNWFKVYGYTSVQVINMYGITEVTVHATYHFLKKDAYSKAIIGKLLPDLSAYVLNDKHQLLPLGAIGELYLGGAGVARGYLNSPKLTAERFINNPFVTEFDCKLGINQKLYKTGDLVRLLPNKNLEYIGRNDFQVKIRGYRIELGEIENACMNFTGIKKCVVVAKYKNELPYLIAYCVSSDFNEEKLALYLSQILPEYMIPAIFVEINALPMTINNKLDYGALPEPKFSVQSKIKAPRNAIDIKLLQIWSEVLALKIGVISIDSNFFRLGGDSILAIRLLTKIKSSMPCQLKVSDIFLWKSIEKISDKIKLLNEYELINEEYSTFSLVNVENYQPYIIDFNQIDDIYPASYLQNGMLLESSLNNFGTYHHVLSYAIKNFDKQKIILLWNALAEKHELLRAGFIKHAETGWSVIIHKLIDVEFHFYTNQNLSSIIYEERLNNFDFAKPGLFRILINQHAQSFDLIFSFHHAIADGWSVASLIHEFIQCYSSESMPSSLKTLHYGEYIRDEIQAIKYGNSLSFWEKYLDNFEYFVPNWKFDNNISNNSLFTNEFTLDKSQFSIAQELSYSHGISVDTIFLLAYVNTLSFFLNNNDLTIGVVNNNRLEHSDSDKMFGLFLNTLPFRVNIAALYASYYPLLDIFNNKLNLINHCKVPFGYLKSIFGKNIYDFSFNFVNFHILERAAQPIKQDFAYERTSIPFVLNVFQGNESFVIKAIVHDDFVSQPYLAYFMQYYQRCLTNILNGKNLKLSLTKADQTQIINWNNTQTPTNNVTVVELFEKQVKQAPSAVALLYGSEQLNYLQLNTQVNKMANYLKMQYGIGTKYLVPIYLERDLHQLIVILAILKTGAAYVPLDPQYPAARIQYILNDTKAHLVITQLKLCDNLLKINASHQVSFLLIDEPATLAAISSQDCSNLAINILGQELAYVIYTSGTTGSPKGVMIPHKGIVNRIQWMQAVYPLLSQDRILQKTPYIFDVSVWEFLWPVCFGSTMVVAKPQAHLDPICLLEHIEQDNITIIHFVPSMLGAFLSALESHLAPKQLATKLKSLRYLFASGESLSSANVKKTHYLIPKVQLCNLYGPTEASIDVLHFSCESVEEKVYIGRPIYNTKAYILADDLTPLPIGAIGELYISGQGLAKGYLNNLALTVKKFIVNPFVKLEKNTNLLYERMYKTGDLVRRVPDGNIEFIGRNDFQIKLNGYRIELGEIEAALLKLPVIHQCVVILNNGQTQLLAYYVCKHPLVADFLVKHLAKIIPGYMIPAHFVHLDELPLTLNGKLDRAALLAAQTFNSTFVPARNEIEHQLCAIWAQLLNIETKTISIVDDFFSLGGDSITSIRLVAKIKQKLNLNLTINEIFQYKTIKSLYDNVFSLMTNNSSQLLTINLESKALLGECPLLPIQQWFFNQSLAYASHWNQAFLIRAPALDLSRLHQSLKLLIEYHDVFRLRFSQDDFGVRQYYTPVLKDFNIHYCSIQNIVVNNLESQSAALTKLFTAWQSNFNLANGPLYSIGVVHGFEDNSLIIHFAAHHLLIDTISWHILRDDLYQLYYQKNLEAKKTNYRQWVNTIQAYKDHHVEEKKYWSQLMANCHAPQLAQYELEAISESLIILDEKRTHSLLTEANEALGTQINDLLLSAWAASLPAISNQQINYVTLEGHGREPIDPTIDLTRTIGWFTSLYPVRLEELESIEDTVESTKDMLRAIPRKGIGYGALFGYQIDALPRIMYNYLGRLNESLHSNWQLDLNNTGELTDKRNLTPNIISINIWVANDKLHYCVSTKLGPEQTNQLSKIFKQKIYKILDKLLGLQKKLTISDINEIISRKLLNNIQFHSKISNIYKANNLQQGLIYHYLSQDQIDDAYHVQLIWEYKDYLHVHYLKSAWQNVQKRFSALRLSFSWDEQIIQIVNENVELNWNYIDLNSKEQDVDFAINEIKDKDKKNVYKLEYGNLFRIYLIKIAANNYRCLLSYHHSILDGWSIPILLQTVHDYYFDMINNQTIIYKMDEAYHQAQLYLQSKPDQLSSSIFEVIDKIDKSSRLNLLTKKNQPITDISSVKRICEPQTYEIVVGLDKYIKLKNICDNYTVTFSSILQFAWHKILNIFGDATTTIVGTVVSGRDILINNIDEAVGLFINTLPIVLNHEEINNISIIESIVQVQQQVNQLNTNSNVNLAKINKQEKRLFDCLFIYENYPNPFNHKDSSKLNIDFLESVEKVDYPLSIVAHEINQSIIIKLNYEGAIFDRQYILSLMQSLEYFIEQIACNPKMLNHQLNYVNHDFIEKINKFNSTDYEHKYSNILDAVAEQIAINSKNVALIYEDYKLNYQDLNIRVNQLASLIKQRLALCSYNPSSPLIISLCLERSLEMVISMLAILKVDAAFLPINPDTPELRICHMLNDSQAALHIISQDILQSIDVYKTIDSKFCIIIDSKETALALNQQHSFEGVPKGSHSGIAYVLYTSGTSGNPKGVLVGHRSLANHMGWMQRVFSYTTNDVFLAQTNYQFDASIWEWMLPLMLGASCVITKSDNYGDPDNIRHLAIQHGISIIQIVPTLLPTLITGLKEDFNKLKLRKIFCGGEPLYSSSSWQVLFKHSIKLYNLYGPTECTIDSSFYEICPFNFAENKGVQFIGSAIDNTQYYVVRDNNKLSPIGVVGELYISGLAVAEGYLNNPSLTKAKFIDSPSDLAIFGNKKYYRTGDLVRWMPDGNLDYIGRNDHQIKLRGNRIELSEIEAVLLTMPGITHAVAIMVEHPSKSQLIDKPSILAIYYVAKTTINEPKIIAYLAQYLPTYMLPASYICLPYLPLTANNKVDKSALPAPDLNIARKHIEPSNSLEQSLVAIWHELLDLNNLQISVNDDFFKLGGDSITSIQLVSSLRQKLNVFLSVKEVFSLRTISRMAEKILMQNACTTDLDILFESGKLSGQCELSPIQKWFFAQDFHKKHYWNQAFLIKTPFLDISKLQESLIKLINYHDAFRLRFTTKNNKVLQYYAVESLDYNIQVLDLSKMTFSLNTKEHASYLKAYLSERQSNFNLEKGPMHSINIIHGFNDNSLRIHFAVHHLLIDSLSWRILIEDLYQIYNNYQLSTKQTSYRQWAKKISSYSNLYPKEATYWREILANYKSNFNEYKNDCYSFSKLVLDKSLTKKLLQQINEVMHTQVDELLLSALALTLPTVTNNQLNYVTLEGHGREEIWQNVDVTRTMGWFTALFPICLQKFDSLVECIINIKNILRKIPNKGIGYGVLCGYSQNNLPNISFNYLGQFNKHTQHDWSLINEEAGITVAADNFEHNVISFNGWVIAGELNFTVATKLGEKATSHLAQNYKHNLVSLIHQLSKSPIMPYTASDFFKVESEADLLQLPIQQSSPYQWFPMTEVQQAYLLGRLDNYEIGNIANHIYLEYAYQTLDVSKLNKAINALIGKQPVLRTVFSFETLKQKFLTLQEIKPYKITVNDYSEKISSYNLCKIRDRLSHHVFNPEQYPLFYFEVSIFKDQIILHINLDLLIMDGQSRELFFKALNEIYRQDDINVYQPNVGITFKDYQQYIEMLKHSNWYVVDKQYWLNKIYKMPLRPKLPFKMPPEKIKKPKFVNHTLFIKNEVWDKFKLKVSQKGLSNSGVLLSLYGSVLAYFSGTKEFLITMTLFNRYSIYSKIDEVWGDFTSTNLFHFKDFGEQLLQTITQNHETLWNDISHALYPGMKVQRQLMHEKNLEIHKAVSPLVFTSVINCASDNHIESEFLEDDEQVDKRYVCGQTSQAWIDLQAIETKQGFMSKWMYVEQLFAPEYISQMNELFCALINHLAYNEWNTSSHLFKLQDSDWQLIEAANSDSITPSMPTLYSGFLDKAKQQKFACQTAVIQAQTLQQYTYAQLLIDSSQLAHYLYQYIKKLRPKPKLISILCEKGYNQVLATIAIMRCGCAFLPLNSAWPVARICEVLLQGGAEVVLISNKLYKNVDLVDKLQLHCELLIIDNIINEPDSSLIHEILPESSSQDVAYVIFTSGSTGKPKGVTITHGAAQNTIEAINQRFEINATDKILALCDLSFDLAIYDIFGLLAAGGTIVFPKNSTLLDPNIELMQQFAITLWNTVPQFAGLLVDELEQISQQLPKLRLFLLSGDWIPLKLPQRLKKRCPAAKVISLGGATEGSIWSIWYQINTIDPTWTSIPYGYAMPNQKMYVLNNNLQHCPVGVIGEIYIGGAGVATGYWRNLEMTKNSFIFTQQLGKLYKTGDLGKWNKAGYLEYIGRNDFQVKIRGYRVELGDIEQAFVAIPTIEQCVVVAITREENKDDKHLIAFYQAAMPLEREELLDYLSTKLPTYMLPSTMVHLLQFPLTANGKIDRENINIKAKNLSVSRHSYTYARNIIEAKLVNIFADVLELEKISVFDDFFSLGGNSISSVRLVAQIKQSFNIALAITTIFKYPVLADMAKQIGQKTYQQDIDIILPIQTMGTKLPLFLIHPAEGLSAPYNILNYYMHDTPLYGINSPCFSKIKDKISSIERMAQSYISAIKTIQASGPYRLCGWSSGGLLAFELARHLRNLGDEIQVVIMLDTYYPEISAKLDSFNVSDAYVKQVLANQGIEPESAEGKYFYAEMVNSMKICSKYIAPDFACNLFLIKAGDDHPNIKFNGWDSLPSVHIQSTAVPGKHGRLMDEDYVAAVAHAIQQSLEVKLIVQEEVI